MAARAFVLRPSSFVESISEETASTRALFRTLIGLFDRRPGALGSIGVGSSDAIWVVTRALVGVGQRVDRLNGGGQQCGGGWRIFVRSVRGGAGLFMGLAEQQQPNIAAPHAAGWVATAQGRQRRT